MSTRKLIGFMLIAGLILAGCEIVTNAITAEETVSKSFEVSAPPSIVVETFNGRIEVNAGSDGSVMIEAVKRGSGASPAQAQDDLKNVEVVMTQEGDSLRIIARRTDSPFSTGNSGASFTLTVPAGSSLDLSTSNGPITSDGVTGDVRMHTSNGSLDVRGGAGRLQLSTSNGAVRVEATRASIDIQTSNGRITFEGSLAEGSHTFDTSNGSIEITLPADAAFRVDARTSNSQVSTDFPVTVEGALDDNALRGTVGQNPAVSIKVTSSNGSISIHRSR